jgi:hypothetical protein
MLRIYCDTGRYRAELAEFEREGRVQLHQFKYENRNKRIRHGAVPSQPTWKQLNYTWNELRRIDEFRTLTWDQLGESSPKFEPLLALLGRENITDAKHLDSACATGCSVFLTSDKDDIWSKRAEIERITGLKVMHVQADWSALLSLLQQ